MIVPPRPWTSLSDGDYLITSLTLLKRQATKRARQLLENADLAIVFSAVNALQNSGRRPHDADDQSSSHGGHPAFRDGARQLRRSCVRYRPAASCKSRGIRSHLFRTGL